MEKMNVLIACEFSGRVRSEFKKKGHNVTSCDLIASDDSSPDHIIGDIAPLLKKKYPWDLIIAFPPCQFLANSGVRWLAGNNDRIHKMQKAAAFFNIFLNAHCEKIAIENPIQHKYAREIIKVKYDQVIQPWQFGEDASKKTCLWLKGLPPLKHTKIIRKKRYSNQTPSGQNNLGPGENRAKLRSTTYHGIAQAMANQWG